MKRTRYVNLQRQYTTLMFEEDGFNPSSSMQIAQVGDIGTVHSLVGPGFYRSLASTGLTPFRDEGITKVYTAVSEGHLRLMQAQLQDARIQQVDVCRINGKDIPWILITDLQPTR